MTSTTDPASAPSPSVRQARRTLVRQVFLLAFSVAAVLLVVLVPVAEFARSGDTASELTASLVGVVLIVASFGLVALGTLRSARSYARTVAGIVAAMADARLRNFGLPLTVVQPVAVVPDDPELVALSRLLDARVARMNAVVDAERSLASRASHQLRGPLTALSLRLEEILERAEEPVAVRVEAERALAQVDRLGLAVADVLSAGLGRSPGLSTSVDLDTLLDSQLAEWRTAFTAAGRCTVREGTRQLRAFCPPSVVAHSLAALLENSLQHGAGTVTVRTSVDGGMIHVDVLDEGPGLPEGLDVFEPGVRGPRSGGTGLGLATARDLLEAVGCELAVLQRRPAAFRMALSAALGPDPRPQDLTPRRGTADPEGPGPGR